MIELEYIVALLHHDGQSVAVKSKKIHRQNPAVEIQRAGQDFKLQLSGLVPGTVEPSDNLDPAKPRLDIYISKADLIRQRSDMPSPNRQPTNKSLPLTNPSGTERKGNNS